MTKISGAQTWTSPSVKMQAVFLAPVPVTRDNLTAVVDVGWIGKDALCQGVSNGPAPCN